MSLAGGYFPANGENHPRPPQSCQEARKECVVVFYHTFEILEEPKIGMWGKRPAGLPAVVLVLFFLISAGPRIRFFFFSPKKAFHNVKVKE